MYIRKANQVIKAIRTCNESDVSKVLKYLDLICLLEKSLNKIDEINEEANCLEVDIELRVVKRAMMRLISQIKVTIYHL